MTGVDASNPDLVVVVADEDAKQMVEVMIGRGIERRCLAPIDCVFLKDEMKDAGVSRVPERVFAPMLPDPDLRVLVLWDHHGSGFFKQPREIEDAVVARLESVGVGRSHASAIAFVPELEVSLGPVWQGVSEFLAKKRNATPPAREVLLSRLPKALHGESFELVLEQHPKELFDALLRCLNLRHSSRLFAELGGALSIPTLKQGHALGRVAAALMAWFPPPAPKQT